MLIKSHLLFNNIFILFYEVIFFFLEFIFLNGELFNACDPISILLKKWNLRNTTWIRVVYFITNEAFFCFSAFRSFAKFSAYSNASFNFFKQDWYFCSLSDASDLLFDFSIWRDSSWHFFWPSCSLVLENSCSVRRRPVSSSF